MSKQIRFYVIGGQYERVCYGGTPTLLGAKRLASKHEEYWDSSGSETDTFLTLIITPPKELHQH